MTDSVEIAYRAIRSGVLDGRYPIGSHLNAQDLAHTLGISRTPVREALRRLDAEGLVNFIPNQGAFVSVSATRDAAEALTIRLLLEPEATALAVVQMTAEDIDELETLATRTLELSLLVDEQGYDELVDTNVRLHGLLLQATGNRRLAGIVRGLMEAMGRHTMIRAFDTASLTVLSQQHLELARAARARDGQWASAIMRAHLHLMQHLYLQQQSMDLAG